MKKARYICLEGTEGVGKTTQTQKLVDYLRGRGFSVMQTKEPGTPFAPVTLQLRAIMLDNQYDSQLTRQAREFISQAIRSISMEKVILPAMNEYDFIIQDRGVLTGLAYGTGCDNDPDFLKMLAKEVTPEELYFNNGKLIYDDVIYLRGNIKEGLQKALAAKQEFATGDAMESRGNSFMENVSNHMLNFSEDFNCSHIDVQGKSIDEVFAEILTALKIKE